MFDIGFFEIVVIGIVALVVIGPEQLPSTIRTIGLWWGRIKRTVQTTRSEIEQQIGADDIRRQLHNEDVMQRIAASKAEIDIEIKRTLTQDIDPLGDVAENNQPTNK
jgi:sec-independent protein translocase protein TatB